MADETKAPQIENPEKITVRELRKWLSKCGITNAVANGTQPRKSWQRWKVGNAGLMPSLPLSLIRS